MVKIAHARIDERGKISGGEAGNQNGKELCTRSWYSKPWNVVIRFKDVSMRQKAADCMLRAVNNQRIGYDQAQRNTLLLYARNVGYDPSKVTVFCETDCSALVTLACIYAGVPETVLVVNGNSATTSTLRSRLQATGAVEVFTGTEYTASDKKLLTGDILLSEGHHTAVVVQVERKGMRTSQNGIKLIKQFEGCRLQSYKAVPTEQYYTIGYGHYGADVSQNMTITQATADSLLVSDLARFEQQVIDTGLTLNQNQFDALVSFAYNCGGKNLLQLIKNRTPEQIADAMLLYNKAGGKILEGLNRRRKAERELFLTGMKERQNGNPYDEPVATLKKGNKGNGVRWIQYQLNVKGGYKLIVDGNFGVLTDGAVRDFQKKTGITVDGIVGPITRMKLLE